MIQVVEMSHQEKVEMYRLVDKEKLIEMLIECNNTITRITPKVIFISHCTCAKPWGVNGVCAVCEQPIKIP